MANQKLYLTTTGYPKMVPGSFTQGNFRVVLSVFGNFLL